MKKITPFGKVLIGTLALALIAAGTVCYFAWYRKGADTPPVATPPITEDILQRTVAGSPWSYHLSNTEAETKFHIKVTAHDNASELTITGKGCNSMSARVSTKKPETYEKERTIDGQVYYLEGATSTLMGCAGEAADYDAQVGEEFIRVFESLEKRYVSFLRENENCCPSSSDTAPIAVSDCRSTSTDFSFLPSSRGEPEPESGNLI